MPTALAVSPHLDDAVFSAGGTLARLVREGWRVLVVTVFTASVTNPGGFALACQLDKGLAPDIDYMALRRNEDAAACAMLGAETIWLPFPEAPHRGYESAADLFAGLHEDDRTVAAISHHLKALIDTVAPDLVLAPQCVGAHVDHIAVHLALRSCVRHLRLWVDFPYSARPNGRPSPFADDFAKSATCANKLHSDDLNAKLDAASCYTSQLGFQFGGAAEARATLARFGDIEYFLDLTITPHTAGI